MMSDRQKKRFHVGSSSSWVDDFQENAQSIAQRVKRLCVRDGEIVVASELVTEGEAGIDEDGSTSSKSEREQSENTTEVYCSECHKLIDGYKSCSECSSSSLNEEDRNYIREIIDNRDKNPDRTEASEESERIRSAYFGMNELLRELHIQRIHRLPTSSQIRLQHKKYQAFHKEQ